LTSVTTHDQSQPPRLQIDDERSGQVVFVSHCLLNANTRYPGGAFWRGAATELIEPYINNGVGICQLPCPEQLAWGGVAKRSIVWFWGRPRAYRPAKLGLRLFLAYTRLRYRRLAKAVARQVADYVANGVEVLGVIGVEGSPSCGVTTTMDVERAMCALVGRDATDLNQHTVNASVAGALRSGRGIFIDELQAALVRDGLRIEFLEHDLGNSVHVELASRDSSRS